MNKRRIIDIPEEYRPKIEELPGQLRELARAVEEEFPTLGVPVTLAIAQRFGGTSLYICGIDKLLQQMRDDLIRRDYDRGNIPMRKLALREGLSMTSIKRILAEPGTKDRDNATNDRQLRMF